MPKSTLFPVTFDDFQAILNNMGYFLASHVGTSGFHWKRDGHAKSFPNHDQATWPILVTSGIPDFECDKCNELVYDRGYVIDLIYQIIGQNSAQGEELFAFLDRPSRH